MASYLLDRWRLQCDDSSGVEQDLEIEQLKRECEQAQQRNEQLARLNEQIEEALRRGGRGDA